MAQGQVERANGPFDLPTGTITFVLTDVVGSTRLWEQAPEAMRAALERHDLLVETAVTAHGGVPVRPRGEGDSRFAVFDRATDAAGAAVDIQRSLDREDWPTPVPIRVRMALVTGDADLREGDYYGTVVNRCARLRAIGHPGQILLAWRTAELVRRALPPGASLAGLGTHRLKDLTDPESVFQLCHPDLDGDFPALRSSWAAGADHDPFEDHDSHEFTANAYRALVLIDSNETAGTMLAVACGIAGAESPAEVVLSRFSAQPRKLTRGAGAFAEQLTFMAETFDDLRALEEQVKAQGLQAAAFSRFTDDLVGDLSIQAQRVRARVVVVGDRRNDPAWATTIAEIAGGVPCDVAVAVAPEAASRTELSASVPVVQAADGADGVASLELGVRIAASRATLPWVLRPRQLEPDGEFERVLRRLERHGDALPVLDVDLSDPVAGESFEGAVVLLRAFTGGYAGTALQAARTTADLFGFPVVLVAADPNEPERDQRVGDLASLLRSSVVKGCVRDTTGDDRTDHTAAGRDG